MSVFKDNARGFEEATTVCEDVHAFRDFLTGIQIHGYTLVSACLNFRGQHDIALILAKVSMQRLEQQEAILGGYQNDWYHYGKASCSYQIQMLNERNKCIQIPDTQVQTFNDYINVNVG